MAWSSSKTPALVTPGSRSTARSPVRAAKSITIRSACRRRAANASASSDGRSSHCTSSTQHSTGRSAAASRSRPSTAAESANISSWPQAPLSSTRVRMAACGTGRPVTRSAIGPSSRCRPAKGRSASRSLPLVASTRNDFVEFAAASSSAVLPTPTSPYSDNAEPRPSLALASVTVIASCRSLRPRRPASVTIDGPNIPQVLPTGNGLGRGRQFCRCEKSSPPTRLPTHHPDTHHPPGTGQPVPGSGTDTGANPAGAAPSGVSHRYSFVTTTLHRSC